MKIAEVVATFPPYHGGMGYVCFHNARELSLRGHDVTVFTIDHGRLSYEKDPVNTKTLPVRPLSFISALLALRTQKLVDKFLKKILIVST